MTQDNKSGLEQAPSKLPAGRAVRLHGLTDYVPGSVVSRILLKNTAGTITLFAFDAGETVLMPANVPHALYATKPFKMLLTMIRGA